MFNGTDPKTLQPPEEVVSRQQFPPNIQILFDCRSGSEARALPQKSAKSQSTCDSVN